MTKRLTPDALDDFRRNGFFYPLRCLPHREAMGYAARYDEIVDRFGDDARGVGPMTKRPHLYLSWVADLVRSPAIVDAVEDIIGPDILCWSSSFFIKEPGDGQYHGWHQDGLYFSLAGGAVVTAWVALTPSTIANGCTRFLPASHHALMEHDKVAGPRDMLPRNQMNIGGIDESLAVDAELDAGEFVLFHVNMAHCSRTNMGSQRRIGLTIRYVSGTVYQTKDRKESASLIRGRDLTGQFVREPLPIRDFDPAALEFQSRARARRWIE